MLSDFVLSTSQIWQIAKTFRQEMEAGLNHKGRLQMLPSFLALPSGSERGGYGAIDFGGTNVRALKVKLCGARQLQVSRQISKPLKEPNGKYDFTRSTASAEELFDFIAGMMKSVAVNEPFGFTFSYGCKQESATKACLIKWTKELNTSGVVGQDVGLLLQQAMLRQNINLSLEAILNDTVATLLAGAYMYDHADIGSICGTGHNSCYYDKKLGMVINIESGNFDKLWFTAYDEQINRNSDCQGEQRLEKMVSGKYLSELIRIILKDRLKSAQIPYALLDQMENPYGLSIQQVMQADYASYQEAAEIIQAVITRSAQLAAATYLGIILFIDNDLVHFHKVVIDGALFADNAIFKQTLGETILTASEDKEHLSLVQVSNGSGLGAAVAAALHQK